MKNKALRIICFILCSGAAALFIVPYIHHKLIEDGSLAEAANHMLRWLVNYSGHKIDRAKSIGDFLFAIILLVLYVPYYAVVLPLFFLFVIISLIEYGYVSSGILSLFAGWILGWFILSPIFYGTYVLLSRLWFYLMVAVGLAAYRKQGGSVVDYDTIVKIPDRFDMNEINYGLQKYRNNGGLISTYIKGVLDRYHTQKQVEIIKRQIELFNIAREYWEAAYKAVMAKYHYEMISDEIEVKKMELDAKKEEARLKKAEAERNLELLRANTKAGVAQLHLEETNATLKAAEQLRNTRLKAEEVGKDEIQSKIEKIKQGLMSEQIARGELYVWCTKQGLSSDDIERILEDFDRRIMQEGVKKGDRWRF